MGSYAIEWKRSAVKELRALPKEAIGRILKAVEGLATEPFPPGTRKLAGAESTFRIRDGVYRIIYTVAQQQLVIEIIRVAHRREAYRR